MDVAAREAGRQVTVGFDGVSVKLELATNVDDDGEGFGIGEGWLEKVFFGGRRGWDVDRGAGCCKLCRVCADTLFQWSTLSSSMHSADRALAPSFSIRSSQGEEPREGCEAGSSTDNIKRLA